jgi:hypothetical protein
LLFIYLIKNNVSRIIAIIPGVFIYRSGLNFIIRNSGIYFRNKNADKEIQIDFDQWVNKSW